SSLGESGLAARLVRLAKDKGVDPARIVLGVAESGVDTDRGAAMETLSRLRIAGFGLAIEDFGTGAMWAEQLSRIAFTELRISGNLISGFRGDNTARAGLVVALDTAHQMKIPAVAQGLTSLDEWNLLQAWGCAYGRGPFISAPLAPAAIVPWLDAHNSRASVRGITGSELDISQPAVLPPASDKPS
ncbi:MAG TPA: EAL domain-containing protein, partial [Ramlibacter sp.]|nr:EAL domain-containing protein [Ramlibacter sp.]